MSLALSLLLAHNLSVSISLSLSVSVSLCLCLSLSHCLLPARLSLCFSAFKAKYIELHRHSRLLQALSDTLWTTVNTTVAALNGSIQAEITAALSNETALSGVVVACSGAK